MRLQLAQSAQYVNMTHCCDAVDAAEKGHRRVVQLQGQLQDTQVAPDTLERLRYCAAPLANCARLYQQSG